jgi:hypothetical protein
VRAVLLTVAILAAIPAAARAHGPIPSEAPLTDPMAACTTADETYTFHWYDYDRPIRTGTATVDLYFTADNCPTFSRGEIPPHLASTSTAIVRGILEKDTTDTFTWRTSTVASGSYWIWSHVDDPPAEFGTVSYVSFAPFPLTIQHPGDPKAPSIAITAPDSPFRFTDDHFPVKYAACDETGTAKVKLEYTEAQDGTGFRLIADDLPVTEMGTYEWSTPCVPEGDVTLRATITDARGLSFTSCARFFLLVTHLIPPDGGCDLEPDGGVAGSDGRASASDAAGTADGGTSAGDAPPGAGSKGCACSARPAARSDPSIALALGLCLLLFVHRRAR